MKVAVLYDALDANRQIFSDAGLSIRKAIKQAEKVIDGIVAVQVSNSENLSLLSNLATGDVDVLVVSSNAIRHPDSQVAAAFEASLDELTGFLSRGGSLLVLHQFQSPLEKLALPGGGGLSFAPRSESKLRRDELVRQADDVLFNFPFEIDLGAQLAEPGNQLGDLISWLGCNAPEETFVPVVSDPVGNVLIARSRFGLPGRIVISAIPLDWHGAIDLLANALCFLMADEPKQILWLGGGSPIEANRPVSGRSGYFSLPAGEISASVKKWISKRELLSIGSEGAEQNASGFSLRVSSTALDQVTLTGSLGLSSSKFARQITAGLELSEIGLSFVTQPYPLRNLVESLSYLAATFPEAGFWDPAKDEEFRARFKSLEFSNMTATSALASLQTAVCLRLPARVQEQISKRVRALLGDSTEDRLFLQLLEVIAGKQGFDLWLDEIGKVGTELTPAAAARALEWVGFLIHNAGHQPADESLVSANRALLSTLVPNGDLRQSSLSTEGLSSLIAAIVAQSSLSEEDNALVRIACNEIREFLRSSDVPEQMSLRVKSASAIAMAERVMPNVTSQLLETLMELAGANDENGGELVRQQRVAQLGEQLELAQDRLSRSLAEKESRQPVWLLGAVSAWVLALGSWVLLGILWLQIFQFNGLSDIFAVPLGIGALWLAYQVLLLLMRNSLTPPWLNRLIISLPWSRRRR